MPELLNFKYKWFHGFFIAILLCCFFYYESLTNLYEEYKVLQHKAMIFTETEEIPQEQEIVSNKEAITWQILIAWLDEFSLNLKQIKFINTKYCQLGTSISLMIAGEEEAIFNFILKALNANIILQNFSYRMEDGQISGNFQICILKPLSN